MSNAMVTCTQMRQLQPRRHKAVKLTGRQEPLQNTNESTTNYT